MSTPRLRIAWFSPLIEQGESPRSLSQYCSDLLLPILKDRFEIETFSSSFSTPYPWIKHSHYLNAYKRHREHPFDLFFYQLEDGVAGRFARTQVGMYPGVTWVHDIFLGDLGSEALHTSPWERTVAQFHENSLLFSERDHLPHQLRPHAYREVSVSPLVLFDSHWARKEFLGLVSNRVEHVNGAHRSEYVPVPVRATPALRKSVSGRTFEIVTQSSPGIEGHMHKSLQALKALKGPWHLTWMLDASESSRARALVEEFEASDRVTLLEDRSTGVWNELLLTADVALHLHNSPFGHLGPYLHLSMAAGVPSVVLKAAGGEEFPAEAVFLVVAGAFETAQLLGIFEALSREGGRRFGEAGREFISREADVTKVAKQLETLFHDVAPSFSEVLPRWAALYDRAEDALVSEIKPLVDSADSGVPSAFELIITPFVEEIRSFARGCSRSQ
jgi:glycosyltransferase involved in cell wall biosynthesis